MANGRGLKVNRAELSGVFGVSLPTIDAWVRAGAPFDVRGAGKGKPWVFDTADVAAWLEARAASNATGKNADADEATLRKRKLAAETQKAELELAKEMQLVAPLDQVERTLARLFAEIRGNLRNIPSRCASIVVGETDERKVKAALMTEIHLVLEALAKFDVNTEDTDDEDQGEDDDDA